MVVFQGSLFSACSLRLFFPPDLFSPYCFITSTTPYYFLCAIRLLEATAAEWVTE